MSVLETRTVRGRKVTTDVLAKHRVNHVVVGVDKSGSMKPYEATVIRAVDEFIETLRAGSEERVDEHGRKLPRQETRISLYAFDHQVECLVWDMSVHDLPSMRDVYRVDGGATSLIEATVVSLEDLKNEVSQKYGEHSFLQLIWTDGIDNASGISETGEMHSSPDGRHVVHPAQLDRWKRRIRDLQDSLPGHWTSAILVPGALAKQKAQEYGFAPGNIDIWDATTAQGVEEAVGTMKTAAQNFLRGRDKGVRGTRNLFAVGQDLDIATVKSVLTPLKGTEYKFLKVRSEDHDKEIRPFVEERMPGVTYRQGMAYYQLGPRVTVQASKDVVVCDDNGLVYGGPDARELLFGEDGRTNGSLSVKAGHNPKLRVFVQSKSVNRKLKKGTDLLVML